MVKRDGGEKIDHHKDDPITGRTPSNPGSLVDFLLKTPVKEIKIRFPQPRPDPSFSVERIVVDGFGPHNGPNDLEIANGLTLLTGENGTGKTHLLLAVHWCLFGERGSLDPWMSEADPLGSDLVNWGRARSGERRMSVDLTFKWGGERFKAIRRIKDDREEFTLENLDNGSMIDNGTPKGLTPDILPYLIFQGEAVMFLASEDPFLKDGNLKDVIKTLSGSGEIARILELLDQARSILIERSRALRSAADPLETELISLEERYNSQEGSINELKDEIVKISSRKKGSLSSYKKALKDLSGSGIVSTEETKMAMAKARAPLIQENLNEMLAGSGGEIIRKMTERALDRCLKEREKRIKDRMMFGAFDSQISIVKSISETGKCLCGTSIGRTGMGRENIKALLVRLEERRDELKGLGEEPIWSSDQVLEGARMCLAKSSFDRVKFSETVKEMEQIEWTLSKGSPKDHGTRIETLISTVRDFERDSALLEGKREELRDLKIKIKELKDEIKDIQRKLVKLWGTSDGSKDHGKRLAILDRSIEDMNSRSGTLMDEMRKTIENGANSILKDIDPGEKLGRIRIHSKTYRLGRETSSNDGGRILPMAYLSAGERELMALSVISSIPGISDGMLMLDSPFPYIDSTRRARILDGLPLISNRVFISFPDGTLNDKELERAKSSWKEKGKEFKHYRLIMEKKGSSLIELGGSDK